MNSHPPHEELQPPHGPEEPHNECGSLWSLAPDCGSQNIQTHTIVTGYITLDDKA